MGPNALKEDSGERKSAIHQIPVLSIREINGGGEMYKCHFGELPPSSSMVDQFFNKYVLHFC